MATTHHSIENYPIHRVPATRPFLWLQQAWEDFLHHRGASLAYGAIVSILGVLILSYSRHPLVLAGVMSAFLLVGPIFTAGLCELSRCRDQGETTDFQQSLTALTKNRERLFEFSLALLFMAITWFALTGLFIYGSTGTLAPSIGATVWGDVMRHISTTQLAYYVGIGAILATVVFALSVVSVPMIIDRHVDARVAMRMSLKITARDFPAMLIWAALIVALVIVGFATKLVGMVIIFPLLGHATWHAYRELVEH